MEATAQAVHRVGFIVVASLLVLIGLAGIEVPGMMQLGALAIAVALFGIPHGAVDPLLARLSGVATSPLQMVLFFVAYIVLAMLVVAAWILAPVLSLGVFLAISIWHFRGDWAKEVSLLQSSAAAAAVVCTPALFHPEATTALFSTLTFGAAVEPVVTTARMIAIVAIVALAGTVIARIRRQPLAMLELMSLPLLAWLLPPLLFFIVYFCGLHSPRHIIESARVLSWRSPAVRMTVFAISVVTITAAVGIYAVLPAVDVAPRLLAVVFVGLAALTVPHMLLLEVVAHRSNFPKIPSG